MWTEDVISGKTMGEQSLNHIFGGEILIVVPEITSHIPCPTCAKFFGALDAQQCSEIQFCSSDLAGQTFG